MKMRVTGLHTYQAMPETGTRFRTRKWRVTVTAARGEMATVGWILYDPDGRGCGGQRRRYACYLDVDRPAREGTGTYLCHDRSLRRALRLVSERVDRHLARIPA